MKQHINGLVAVSICIILVSILIFKKDKLRKVLEKKTFWIIFNTVWIAYFVGARYIPYIVQSSRGFEGSIAKSMLFQNIFMTNVCPMVTMTIAIGSYFKRFRNNFGPSIGIIALFGGVMNMIAIIMNSNTENLFSFLFFKTTVSYINPAETLDNYLWFMTHLILIVQGILLLIMCKKITWKNVILLYIWSFSFMIYIAIIMASTGIRNDVAGLWINDWIQVGNYKGVFYQIGSIIWPAQTHGATSVAKTISGIILLYSFGVVFIVLSWYFINFENKHYKWQKFFGKFKKNNKKAVSTNGETDKNKE
ncbi:DUF5378 family protein [Mycoplasma todarodis]|uniref:Uncharacterized protein n=1 Tax=Mycoplasma todarodis TaxID=1937191 RepID=A0A4R0XSC6_9MOLU|nr:DUF5378 family protein [Mycoplasma todarodis]TCG10597.1 hypothetical protein C4B25_03585 [Mycoplasma todarodis]